MIDERLINLVTEALAELREEHGFYIFENMPCCSSCAFEQMESEGLVNGDSYCFYTRVDEITAQQTGTVSLIWGGEVEPILECLHAAGLETQWAGRTQDRVLVRMR